MRQTVEELSGLFVFRLAAELAATLGLIGLLLGAAGVFGVVSFSASRRTREIGIRMALGANPRDIVVLLSRTAIRLIGTGIAGVVLGWALRRAMAKLLIGANGTDAPTYAIVAALLAAVAAIACWFPARRALRVDPVVALRSE